MFETMQEYAPGWSKEVFNFKNVKNTVLWTYFINDLNGNLFTKKSCKKQIQKNLDRKSNQEKR